MAVYNRATLYHRTGNYRSAIKDYTTVINQYPNFWYGLQQRARCYRQLGMKAQAEKDEFRIFKAQMDKHLGIQPRWTKEKRQQTRKKSEVDMSKYNQIVVADEEETVEREYASIYRGRVQNRKVETVLMPDFILSYIPYGNVLQASQWFDAHVDRAGSKLPSNLRYYINCNPTALDDRTSDRYLRLCDSLSVKLENEKEMGRIKDITLMRAVAYAIVQNYDDAVADLDTYLEIDTASVVALWQRSVCLHLSSDFRLSQGMESQIRLAKALKDVNRAIKLEPDNPFLYYNRANIHARNKDYQAAIADYDKAIALQPNMAEAYYNRGLVYTFIEKRDIGMKDMSRAGELGLHQAYSILKRNAEK